MGATDHRGVRLLLAIVREQWDEATRLAGDGAGRTGEFAELCRESDVAPWVHATLERRDSLDWIGAEDVATLQRIRSKVRSDNMVLVARAEQALGALAAAGVSCIALKGLDLLHRVYDRIDLRTIDDIDLLVRTDDLAGTLSAFESAGWSPPAEPKRTHYVRSSHHLPVRSPGPITVDCEIHWNLAQSGRFAVDVDGLFSRARPLDVSGRPVLRLCDEDYAAHLLLHHFTHYFDRRLKWAVDLRLVTALPDFSWDRVVERVRAWKATVSCGWAVAHLRKLLPGLIPDRVAEALPRVPWRRLLLAPLGSSHPLELMRATRGRRVQLYIAAVLLERPGMLPGWIAHRTLRGGRRQDNPLDEDSR